MVSDLEKEIPNVRASMLTALGNAVPSHLLDTNLFDFKNLTSAVGSVEDELDLAIGHVGKSETPMLVSIM
jgi:tRNA 2-thiocytidine biosynthesis protein TtcA